MDRHGTAEALPRTSPHPLDDDGLLLLVEIVIAIEATLDDLSERLLDRATRELAALGPISRLELGRPVKRGVAAALRDALARLGTYTGPPLELPAETQHAALLWARAGLEISALISACSVADASFWDEFERATRALSPDPELALEAQKRAQRSLAVYSDRLQQLLRSAYNRERELMATDADRRRSLVVSRILGGAHPGPAELGYEFGQHHIAVVAWGERPRERAQALAEQARRRLLATASADGSVWAWLGGGQPFSPDDLVALLESARELGGSMAFGEPGQGVEGFRSSHRQAIQARAAISAGQPDGVTRYGENALLSLLQSCDPTVARAFVGYELAGLLDRDPRSAELRRTLVVHLTHGLRTGTTGNALGIDRHTVRERLDEVERRVGARIESRSAELRAALLLFGGDRDAQPANGTAS